MIKRGREDEDKKENETQHHRGESQRILLAACVRACARVHIHTDRVDAGLFFTSHCAHRSLRLAIIWPQARTAFNIFNPRNLKLNHAK